MVCDGTHEPFPAGVDILYRVIDGNQKQLYTQDQNKSSLSFKDLSFYDNFGGNNTVIASSNSYRQQVSLPSSSPLRESAFFRPDGLLPLLGDGD